MDDQVKGKGQVLFTPRDLIMKSNPAMFSDVKDYTNPRDWYHSLQNDRKQRQSSVWATASASRTANSGLQGLKRTTSMANLSSVGTNMQKKQFSQSQTNLNEDAEDGHIGSSVMSKKTNFSLENLHFVPEETKENVKPLNLPAIKSDNFMVPSDSEQNQNHVKQNYSLPKLNIKTKDGINRNGNAQGHSSEPLNKSVTFDKTVPRKTKINKWILEVGENKNHQKEDEVMLDVNEFDKQHVPKIVSRDNYVIKRTKLPVLKQLQIFPNQFKEFRLDKSANINREHYKLKHKSLYHLKSSENEEKENGNKRINVETDIEYRHYPSNLDKFYFQEKSATLDDIAKATNVRGDGLTKINLDEFAVEAFDIHPHAKFAFAKHQPTSESGSTKASLSLAAWQQNEANQFQFPKLKRESTKASIVNLTLGQSSNVARHVIDSETGSDTSSAANGGNDDKQNKSEGERRVEEYVKNLRHGHPKTAKSVLTKVKELKVFQEVESDDENETNKDRVNGKPSVYKLDLKNYKKPADRTDLKSNDSGLMQDPNVDFQFGSGGEVIITRQSSTAGSSNIVQNSASMRREKSKVSLKNIPDDDINNQLNHDLTSKAKENIQAINESTTVKEVSGVTNQTFSTDKIADSMSPQNLSLKDEKHNVVDQWPEKEKTILSIKMPSKAYDSEVTLSPTNASPPPPPNAEIIAEQRAASPPSPPNTEIITESPVKEREASPSSPPNTEIITDTESPVKQVGEKDDHVSEKELSVTLAEKEEAENSVTKLPVTELIDVTEYDKYARKDVATSMSSLIGDDGRGPDGRRPPS